MVQIDICIKGPISRAIWQIWQSLHDPCVDIEFRLIMQAGQPLAPVTNGVPARQGLRGAPTGKAKNAAPAKSSSAAAGIADGDDAGLQAGSLSR